MEIFNFINHKMKSFSRKLSFSFKSLIAIRRMCDIRAPNGCLVVSLISPFLLFFFHFPSPNYVLYTTREKKFTVSFSFLKTYLN